MGDFPEIHLHFHASGDNTAVLAKLDSLEALMSDNSARFDELDTAVQEMKALVAADVQHLMDLLSQALQTNTDNQAVIDALRADAAATSGRIDTVLSNVRGVDADPSFPVVEPPAEPLVPPIEPPAPEPTP